MSHLQVQDTFQEYVSTSSIILPASHFDASKHTEGEKNGHNDNNRDQIVINTQNGYSAHENNHTEKPNQEMNHLKGKMWREKIRVREREEKKKRLMEVNYFLTLGKFITVIRFDSINMVESSHVRLKLNIIFVFLASNKR